MRKVAHLRVAGILIVAMILLAYKDPIDSSSRAVFK
jgi:hypothetical protein